MLERAPSVGSSEADMDVAALFNQAFSAVNTAGFAMADIFVEEGRVILAVGAAEIRRCL